MSDLSDLERDLSTVSTVRLKVGVLDDEKITTLICQYIKAFLTPARSSRGGGRRCLRGPPAVGARAGGFHC